MAECPEASRYLATGRPRVDDTSVSCKIMLICDYKYVVINTCRIFNISVFATVHLHSDRMVSR